MTADMENLKNNYDNHFQANANDLEEMSRRVD